MAITHGIHHVAYRCRDAKETVEFYRDVDKDNRLNVSKDEELGRDSSSEGGWAWRGNVANWPRGKSTCFARARDNSGDWSDPVSVSVTLP